MEETIKPFMLSILSPSKDFLDDLKSEILGADVEWGNVTKSSEVSEFKFDPISTGLILYKVAGGIGSVGGAIQFLEWLYQKLKSKKAKKMVIKIGKESVEISNIDQMEEQDIRVTVDKVKVKIGLKK